jgi:hypothetical protein
MNYKIAIIPPVEKDDYLLNTVIDGFLELQNENPELEFYSLNFPNPFPQKTQSRFIIDESRFFPFAKEADLIIASFLKNYTNFDLLSSLGRWDNVALIDGTEWGKDRRFDFTIQKQTLDTFLGESRVPDSLLNMCGLYLRREKPYVGGIVPFPYGIESRFQTYAKENPKKDIDFFCVWGQDTHPLMRRYASELLVNFCEENGFTYRVEKTRGFDFSLERVAGRDEYYELLSRSKVGISTGGGGFDATRFWEILGNNCLLMTERIDIYHPDSMVLDFERIYQFNNVYDFWYQLGRVGKFLKDEYDQEKLDNEYQKILKHHSGKARALELVEHARQKRMIS